MQRAAEMLANCAFCEKPLQPDAHTTLQRVTAWEKKSVLASRRGGSDLYLRERQNSFACLSCVEGQRRGVSPLQGALV